MRMSGIRLPIEAFLLRLSIVGSLAALLTGGICCGEKGAEAVPADVTNVDELAGASVAPIAGVETSEIWQELIDQRPNAVVLLDGRLVVNLGTEVARKHLDLAGSPSVMLAQHGEDQTFGVVLGRSAAFDLPLDGELAPALHPDDKHGSGLALAVTMRAHVPGQAVTILWEERPLAHLRVSQMWERRTVSLPKQAIHPGDNRLRLHFAKLGSYDGKDSAAAIKTLEIGPRERLVNGAPEQARPPYRVSRDSSDRDRVVLTVTPGVALAYYVVSPPHTRLLLEVRGRGGIDLVASTDDDHQRGRAPRELLREALRPTLTVHDIALGELAGRPLRIELRVVGSDELSEASIAALSLVVRRPKLIDRRPRSVRDVTVFAVEGARARDLLDLSARPPLSHVRAFFEEAVVFQRAYAVSATAIQSHAAWLASTPPSTHLTVGGTYVAPNQELVTELLDRAGYFNMVLTTNAFVAEERGLLQGVDETRAVVHRSEQNDARSVMGVAWSMLTARSAPRYLYTVVVDPLPPFDPPREVLTNINRPVTAPLPHVTHVWVGRVRTGKLVPDKQAIGYVGRLYRGELQLVDLALSDLMSNLNATRQGDDSIIVFMGVHGQELLDHGSAGHGTTLYEESVHVPLAIRAPALFAPGQVEAPVDLIDLAPTLADLLGLEPAAAWQGESLVSVIDDPVPAPRLVVCYLGDGSRAGIVGDHKLIIGPGVGLEAQRYFDLASDPGEQDDMVRSGRIGLRVVRSALTWHLAHQRTWKRARWGTGANLRPAFATDLGM